MFVHIVRASAFTLISALMPQAQLPPAELARPAIFSIGDSVLSLNGPWKFEIGDSPLNADGKPLWAEPGFDDSKWEVVDLTTKSADVDPTARAAGYVAGWAGRGHASHSGYAWYRIRIRTHARPGQALALAGPQSFDDAYQIFLDGRLLGGFGGFRGRVPETYYAQPVVFPLTGAPSGLGNPTALGSSEEDATQTIAFRFWMAPATLLKQPDGGGFHAAPMLGSADAIAAVGQLGWLALVRQSVAWLVIAVVFSLLGAMAFGLFLFNRTDTAYLWIGAVCALYALGGCETVLAAWTQTLTVPAETWVYNVFDIPAILWAWFMLVRAWFRLDRPRWLPWATALLEFVGALAYAAGLDLLPFVPIAWRPIFFGVYAVTRLCFVPVQCWMAYRGIRSNRTEGWMLAAPLVIFAAFALGGMTSIPLLSRSYAPFGILITPQEIESLLVAAALCALLLRRWLLSAQDQRKTALDLKQAQVVQQMILPEARTALPGIVVESDYRPAREVGGDFFQIIPLRAEPGKDGVLVAIGDVSGKGMPAAILVSLLVGSLQTLIETTTSPAEILAGLNRRAVGRSGGGFTTCLILRIDHDGEMTIANAGHISPYLNGDEMRIENGLPLGLALGAEYTEQTLHLNPNDRLTLMTDGVVEAQSANKELFGFERTASISTQSAENIARAAQHFGQEDDITVLTLKLAPATVAPM